jgi:hypothetical protein
MGKPQFLEEKKTLKKVIFYCRPPTKTTKNIVVSFVFDSGYEKRNLLLSKSQKPIA